MTKAGSALACALALVVISAGCERAMVEDYPVSTDTMTAVDTVAIMPVDTIEPAPGGSAGLPEPGRTARVLYGVAEIQLDSMTYSPADYYRVVLRSGDRTWETITDRSGVYTFENIPAGRYELVFMTVTKDARVVHTTSVDVRADSAGSIPAVHIPLRSLRTRN